MTVTSDPTTGTSPVLAASGPEEALDLRHLGKRFDRILHEIETEQGATDEFVCLARQLLQGVAVCLFELDSTYQIAAKPCSCVPTELSEQSLHQLYLLARRTQDAETAQLVQMQGQNTQVALGVPVFRHDRRVEALVVLTSWTVEDRRQIMSVLQVVQLLAVFAGQWRGSFDRARHSSKLELLEMLTCAADAANRSAQFADAAEIFASSLANHFSARLVALGLRRRGARCTVAGMSHRHSVSRGAPLVEVIESVLAERLAMPEAESVEKLEILEKGTEAVSQLRDATDAQAIYRAAWHDGLGEVHGVLLMICDQLLTPNEMVDLRQACAIIGPHLARLRHTRLPWWQRARVTFERLSIQLRRMVIVGVAAFALALFAVPVPHRVKCHCEVQPVTRRFVGAPYEGRLEDVFVEPGDLVLAGQVLAVMDDHEIRLELSALNAELNRVTKQRDRALANRETAAAQIALLEMERLQTNIQLQNDRIDNLEIRSPTDGVVISGDPQKLKGARLAIGQTLVEVGPLGQMVLELAIPDDQIAQIDERADIRFRLEAMPHVSFQGKLTRIHPRSELREASNVFIGDAEIAADAASLRPGMRGRAKVAAGRHSLFWILFHRAIGHVIFRFG